MNPQPKTFIVRDCACCSDQPTVPPDCPACKGAGGFSRFQIADGLLSRVLPAQPGPAPGGAGGAIEALIKAAWSIDSRMGSELPRAAADQLLVTPEFGITAGDLRLLLKAVRKVAALASIPAVGGAETLQTIAQWCEETFGPVTPERIAKRAAEEMDELLADPAKTEEAADVLICLSRYPGIWAAVEKKMAVNRARKWRLTGDGCGYHVPAAPTQTAREGGE